MRGTANLFSLPLRGGLELLSALGAERQPQTVITKVTNESLLTFFFTSGKRLEPIYRVKISFLETQKEEGRQFTHQEKKGEENRSFGKIEEKEVGCRCTPQEKKG